MLQHYTYNSYFLENKSTDFCYSRFHEYLVKYVTSLLTKVSDWWQVQPYILTKSKHTNWIYVAHSEYMAVKADNITGLVKIGKGYLWVFQFQLFYINMNKEHLQTRQGTNLLQLQINLDCLQGYFREKLGLILPFNNACQLKHRHMIKI